MPTNSHRVFFALWPDDAIARRFDAAGRLAHRALGGRRIRRDTLHLTLAFIGGVPAEGLEILRSVAGAIRLPSFPLNFDRIECLRRKKIAWAAAQPPQALLDLVSALETGLKASHFRTDERPFAAHVTLLRDARCEVAPPETVLHIDWPVRDFVLAESDLHPEGAHYRIVARWPLGQS